MDHSLSLPLLELSLDRLPLARSVTLTSKQIEELFGFNDVGITRVERLTRGHNCIVRYSDDSVIFHKMPPKR